MSMDKITRAALVEECATKVGAWSTSHLPHDHALIVQGELVRISEYLRKRAEGIRTGTVTGLYDASR